MNRIIIDFIEFAKECIPDLKISLHTDAAIIIFEDSTGTYEVPEIDIIEKMSAKIGNISISLLPV